MQTDGRRPVEEGAEGGCGTDNGERDTSDFLRWECEGCGQVCRGETRHMVSTCRVFWSRTWQLGFDEGEHIPCSNLICVRFKVLVCHASRLFLCHV